MHGPLLRRTHEFIEPKSLCERQGLAQPECASQVAKDQVLRELSIPQFYWDHPSALARSPSTAGSLSEEVVQSNVDCVESACEPHTLALLLWAESASTDRLCV